MDKFLAQKGFVYVVDHHFLKCLDGTKEFAI